MQVLSINGCASIIGFREFVTKTVKIAKLDTEDEDEEDNLAQRRLLLSHKKVHSTQHSMILVTLPVLKPNNTLVPHCLGSSLSLYLLVRSQKYH